MSRAIFINPRVPSGPTARVQGAAALKLLVAHLAVLVSLAFTQSAAVAQAPNRSSDEAAIRAAITAMTQAFNAQDTKAWVRLCTADAQLVTARGEVMGGVAEIEKGLTNLFGSRNRAARARTLDATVRFITDDVAVAHVTNELTGVLGPDSQPQPPQRERSLRVFVKDAAVWRLTAFHNTVLQR
jgi:uncharacterized protein (TIGR02246 family)